VPKKTAFPPANAATAEAIVACRDLLRHAHHPTRLRENRLAVRIAATASLALDTCADAQLCLAVGSAIEDALAVLTPRQAAIVRRCDLGGERYDDVARELFVSKRHAFRERDAAIRTMLERLGAMEPVRQIIVHPQTDVLEARIRQARTLEQNGHWQTAASLLEEAVASASDAGVRSGISVRLIRLYVDAERYDDARRNLRFARESLDGAASLAPWQHAEIDVAAARLERMAGDTDLATALISRSKSVLRAAVGNATESRIGNALVAAFLQRAEIANGSGDLAVAAAFASSAREASVSASAVEPEIAIEARLAAAMLAIHGPDGPGRFERTERELFACAAAANTAGLTREEIRVVTHIGLFYRLIGQPDRAVEIMGRHVGIARVIGTRAYAAAFFHGLSSALLEIGAFGRAAAYVPDLRRFALGDSQMEPWAEHLIARLALAERHYADALSSARNSAAGFSRIGQERYVGTALRFEAEALARLGRRGPAIEAAQRAIEILADRSAPVRLAEAYRLLGELTDNPAHLAQSRKLLRSARPTARAGRSARPVRA
jgi:tetratricopeptide (TPR) repeat protein